MDGDWVVIGVGNRDRGDDAVGPVVCERLRARVGSSHLRTVVCEGSIIDLALHWDGDERVVIVDAVAPAGRPGRIVTVDLGRSDAPIGPVPAAVSTHEIDVSAAIELARVLGRMPARLLLIGIEVEQVAWAAPLSPAVAAAAEDVVDRLAALLAVGVGDGAG